jgi:nucleotidyltransferase substrate binding protein (TIGR01987 family)
MERLRERLITAGKALATLEEVMALTRPSAIERDAALQRFEYTFEAVWKAAKQLLLELEGLDMGSPKSVIRASREMGILDEEETVEALQMADDRNLTVHTYNEALASAIYERLKGYVVLLRHWLEEMELRFKLRQ